MSLDDSLELLASPLLSPQSPMDALCRVCHISSPLCLPLFKPLNNPISEKLTTLANILSYCCGLEIVETELFLPHHMCPDCVSKLRLAVEFKRSVHLMDKILRQSHVEFCRNERIDILKTKAGMSPEINEDFIFVLDDQELTDDSADDLKSQVEEEECQEMELRLHEDSLDLELESQEVFAEMEHPAEQHNHNTEEELRLVDEAKGDLYAIVDVTEQPVVETHEPLGSKSRRAKTPNPSFKCLVCGKQLSSKRTFKYHINLHSPYNNSQENSTQNTVYSIEESLHIEPHLQDKDSGELYQIVEETEQVLETQKPLASRTKQGKPHNPSLQCQICRKQLSTTHSFKYHMQLHGTATPYVCKICDKSFKTRNAYDGHMTLHDPNNPNRCPTCSKVYRQASSLRTHLLIHSGIKPFECNICGKRLTQKSGYKKHMLTHTGEKPHGCNICGKSFRYSSNLIAHKRSHTQEKPHYCQVCPKRSFGSRSDLNRHMLVHSSDRPFSCDECGKTFKRQVSLDIHLQTHKGGSKRKGGRKVKDLPKKQDNHEET
ncbi:zinc finger protein 227 [Drosophila rhopaloa]|uniref:Zinc finger protein 227 n=1 Tax=Drosophila rhopaloa TaxID=1041015 RepID=A0A6P4ESU9_DRORH|nr:zinc finger protein 227 [Drosophila rhopaloa]